MEGREGSWIGQGMLSKDGVSAGTQPQPDPQGAAEMSHQSCPHLEARGQGSVPCMSQSLAGEHPQGNV